MTKTVFVGRQIFLGRKIVVFLILLLIMLQNERKNVGKITFWC